MEQTCKYYKALCEIYDIMYDLDSCDADCIFDTLDILDEIFPQNN